MIITIIYDGRSVALRGEQQAVHAQSALDKAAQVVEDILRDIASRHQRCAKSARDVGG